MIDFWYFDIWKNNSDKHIIDLIQKFEMFKYIFIAYYTCEKIMLLVISGKNCKRYEIYC